MKTIKPLFLLITPIVQYTIFCKVEWIGYSMRYVRDVVEVRLGVSGNLV